MKVGILSMQKVPNYGSFLQAFSLKMQMEARGHDVYFVDILPGKQIVPQPEPLVSGKLLSKLDKYAVKRVENYLLYKKMLKLHNYDHETFLETRKKIPEGEMYDLLIIGSDEVFNATTPSRWGFSPQLFGKIDNARRIVTYAASCGSTTFELAYKYRIIQELSAAMANLDAISVRDKNTAEFSEKITGQKPMMHLDPVFISEFEQYIPCIPKRKPYLLVYAYANRISDEREIFAIRQYAKINRLDILCVGMQQRWCNRNIAASAFELLAYIKNAECIVTDTFHGTVFSIKYNKRFVTLIRESNRNKLKDLLEQFELLGRSVAEVNDLKKIMDESIDYNRVNEIIQREKNRAYNYLNEVTAMEN